MPTPSQPINRRRRFPAHTRVIIARRKIRRYLKKPSMLGSICIYQVENSRILHVTIRATGMKRMAYLSNCVVRERLEIPKSNHFKLAEVSIWPSEIKRSKGIRETKNACFTAFLASRWKVLDFGFVKG